jgi:anti-sigma B factor antagonist
MLAITHHEITPGTVVISLSGDLKLGAESEKVTDLVAELLQQGKRVIIFDVAGIDRIDSTGIGRFIASYNKIAAVKGEMRIVGTRTYLFRVFQVSALDKIFRFYPDIEEALKA